MLKILTIIIIIIILSVFVTGEYLIRNVLPYGIIKPVPSKYFNRIDNTIIKGYRTQKIDFMTRDSINIKAILIFSKESSNEFIIILHGIGDRKESNYQKAKFLSENGFNAILVDLRAHGESGGIYCTYGYYEKKDLSDLITYIKQIYGENCKFGIWGTSLGGAIGLQTLEYDKKLSFGIIESTFCSLKQVVRDYSKMYSGIKINFIADRALSRAEEIAKFKSDSINPLNSAKHTKQPVLYIHGTKDERIDYNYGLMIYNALTSNEKELYLVDNAHHLDVPITGGVNYYNRILKFLNKMKNRMDKW